MSVKSNSFRAIGRINQKVSESDRNTSSDSRIKMVNLPAKRRQYFSLRPILSTFYLYKQDMLWTRTIVSKLIL